MCKEVARGIGTTAQRGEDGHLGVGACERGEVEKQQSEVTEA